MASQNPSSVPTVLPNALPSVANFLNNDTSVWSLKGEAGSPIFYDSATLPAGANSSVLLVDTTNFEDGSYYYNVSYSAIGGAGTNGPDSLSGQCGASGVFLISGDSTTLQGGNAVSNLTSGLTVNPGRIQINNGAGGTGVRILTASDASFTGGTVFISYSKLL
jgi:hypothetical protein